MVKDVAKSSWRGRFFRYAPFLLVVGLILFASTTQGSMSETSRFVRPFLEFLFPQAPENTLRLYHAYIRKSAHLIEYAVLAFFAARAFWGSSIRPLKHLWALFAFASVIGVASVDEINQSLNPARTGSFKDVLLDAAGGLLMILVLIIYNRFRNN